MQQIILRISSKTKNRWRIQNSKYRITDILIYQHKTTIKIEFLDSRNMFPSERPAAFHTQASFSKGKTGGLRIAGPRSLNRYGGRARTNISLPHLLY